MQTTTHHTLFVSVLTVFFGLLTLSASAAGDQIAVVDQEIQNQKDSQNGQDNHQVLILNQDANWGAGDSAVVWKVDRKELNGAGWDHLSDVKLRTDSNGVRVVLVTAGGGNVGSINYNTGRLIWHTTIPTDKGTPNPVRHRGYGVTDAHYATVGAALLWTLEQGLGERFTPEVQAAWSSAYTLLANTMRAAAAAAEAQEALVDARAL